MSVLKPAGICWPGAESRISPAELACFLLVFVAVFFVSGQLHPFIQQGFLDASWQTALEYAFSTQRQFGTEIVFTYGPLGFLNCLVSQGNLLGIRIAFALFWSAMVAWAAIDIAAGIPGQAKYLFLFWLLAFTCRGTLDFHVFLLLAFCTRLLFLQSRTRPRACAAAIFTMALLANIKFTFFLSAGAALVMLAGAALLRKEDRLRVGAILAGCSGSFLLIWVLAGQSPANLPSFIGNGLEISAGFNEAMSLTPPPLVAPACFLAGSIFLALVLLASWGRRHESGFSAYGLLMAVYAFMIWKHGLVRADVHVFYYILPLPLLAGALLYRTGPPPLHGSTPQRLLTSLFIAVTVACFSAGTLYQNDFWRRGLTLPQTATGNLLVLGRLLAGDRQSVFTALSPELDRRSVTALIATRELLRGDSVDVLGPRQRDALINRLNYQPRPVIQGYSAYSPALQMLNLAHFTGPKRPAAVLLDQNTIDGRFPTLDDAPLLIEILYNYRLVAKEGPFLVLKDTGRRRQPQRRLLFQRSVAYNEAIDLSGYRSSVLAAEINIPKGPLAALTSFVYSPPVSGILIRSGANAVNFRLPASMTKNGFLLSPLLYDNDAVEKFLGGTNAIPLDSISIVHYRNSGPAWLFPKKVTIRLYALDQVVPQS